MRRVLAAAGASAVALLVIAPAAWSGESIGSGNWSGSTLDAGPSAVSASSYRLSGTFQHKLNRTASVTVSASPAGSGPCSIPQAALASAATPRSFQVTMSIPCNGTYTLSAVATTTDNNAFFPTESATLDRTVAVSAPAPTVTGVQANADGRTVTVSWDDMTSSAPDLSGYLIERKIGAGSFEELATVPADQRSYADSALPDSGGEASYRVSAIRPSPSGDMVSSASREAATPFVAAPTPTTDTTGAGTGGSASGGGGGATGSSGSGGPLSSGQSGAGGARASGGSAPRVSAPHVFSGTFLPPLLRPASQTIATTTTLDTGFNESLPYERGAADPVLPKDAMASIVTTSQAGRGMAIPVATALVLAVWAFHLRMLARAARPLD